MDVPAVQSEIETLNNRSLLLALGQSDVSHVSTWNKTVTVKVPLELWLRIQSVGEKDET